ncbi:importin-5 [Exaiptasia diaphana]|uniref:TOG domain-containing protein n=1 Tax=Exaiptasia diaphana TaxID=2652724 RepID=A0A913XCR9_EXADI|nr:importin-5 [Exaiptasia diaphana]KXJ29691.1 Importin-5 [Exaiptasia diaphana]
MVGSFMMAEQVQQFESLISQLLSISNEIRSQAEAQYEAVDDVTKIHFLLQVLKVSQSPEIRQMAAVLLRRIFANTVDFIKKLGDEALVTVKADLLRGIQEEQNASVRRKICDAASELSKSLLDEEGYNHWQDLLKFLFECCNSQKAELKESALHIFCSFPGVFGNQQDHYLNVIKQMLYQCLNDQTSSEVRFMAARALCAFITDQVAEVKQRQFAELVPGIIQVVRESAQSDGDDTVLKSGLIDLAENCPKMLRPSLEPLIHLLIEIISNANMGENWKHLSVECIVTLAESAPAMVRKVQKFIPLIIPQLLAMMVDLDDSPDWSKSDEIEDEDYESNPVIGESSLDRLACSLGGKTILPHITATIPQMLSNPDWRYRHAGLMAISAVGEGCQKQMEILLADVTNVVLPFLNDQHPRVRYACCNAIGQMSTDFANGFQKKFHMKVIPGLLHVMDDFSNPRVQAHAGAALVNFCEECPKQILLPYLDGILTKLELVLSSKLRELLERGTKLVMEQVVTTIATVANTVEEKFAPYYDRFMPSLKYIVQNANTQDYRLLRGKTIECISFIGLAVGKEKFLPDASEIMQILLKTQTDMDQLEADDPQVSYMISAWARMCKIMGTEFTQYLPLVMPPLMKVASIKPEVAIIDSDDPKSNQYSEDEGWQLISLGDQQKFGINTVGLEEKSTACQMLVLYAKELKDGFAPYTDEVVQLMVPLLKFYFHELVRSAAAESLPYLLECSKFKGDAAVRQMWAYICTDLLKAIRSEPDADIQIIFLENFAKCVETLGNGCLTENFYNLLSAVLHEILTAHKERQMERQNKRKDEDYDEEVEQDLQDENETDVEILSKVADVMHAVLGTHKETSVPFFEQLLPDFNALISPERSEADKQWGLCVFDDVIEYYGLGSFKYQEYFLRATLNFTVDKSPAVRQAACYGVGIMPISSKDYAPACAEALPLLVRVISDPQARSRENINATENAISAVTKICKYNHGNINVDEIIPTWLSWLPIIEDKEEATHVYGYLCDLIEGNNVLVLGSDYSNLSRILQIFADVFLCEVLSDDEETKQRVLRIIAQMQTMDKFNAYFSQLNEMQQDSIRQAITGRQ